MEIIHKKQTGSTNDDIADLANAGYPHLTTVVTDFQTAGRGRRGNKWEAPPGNHLLFSTLVRIDADPQLWNRIPQIAGMEFINALENTFNPEQGIKMKWPNDLYYYDKKWSGILVESRLGKQAFAILGMGVNCKGSSLDYPIELRKSVTTLEEIFKSQPVNPEQLLKSFLARIEASLDHLIDDFSPVVNFANQRDYLYGKTITVQEEARKVAGTACGIGDEGELLVIGENGKQRRIFGGTILEID